jgi:hypothetical protein
MYGTWSVTLKEKHSLSVFQKEMLMRKFGLKKEKVTEDGGTTVLY